MQISGADFLRQTSPEFSRADRDGWGWSSTPDPMPDAAIGDPETCSGRNVDHRLSPPLTPASTPETQELGTRDKSTHPLSPSPAAPVKGAARRHRGRVRPGSSESKLPALACPFYKFDPRSHHDCRGFTLRRVKDIKQHIQRKHTMLPEPEFHCGLRLRTFDAEEHKAAHQQHQQDPHHARACPPRPGRRLRVITGEQTEKLKGYLGRGKPIYEQWYDVWDILFPGERRPRTIHLDSISNSWEGRMKMLRRVWETHRSEILAAVACTPPPVSILGGIRLPGLGGSLDPCCAFPYCHPSSPSTRMLMSATAMSESFAQWRPFDQVMDAFLGLVKEEMTDDVVDTDRPDPDSTEVEAACSLQGAQQPWYPSSNVYCPEDLDSILWQPSVDPEIESPGIDMAAQGTLGLASGDVTYNFPNDLGSPW